MKEPTAKLLQVMTRVNSGHKDKSLSCVAQLSQQVDRRTRQGVTACSSLVSESIESRCESRIIPRQTACTVDQRQR